MRWTWVVVLLMGMAAGSAEACSCDRLPLRAYLTESFDAADTVFVGTSPTGHVAEYGLFAMMGGLLLLGAVGAVFWVGRAVFPRVRPRPT